MPGRSRASRLRERRRTRRAVRARRGLAASSAAVLSVSVLATLDALPLPGTADEPVSAALEPTGRTTTELARGAVSRFLPTPVTGALPAGAAMSTLTSSTPAASTATSAEPTGEPAAEPTPDPDAKPEATAPLPASSGRGKRIVYDIAEQQVWLVDENGSVVRTYMVSGSKYDQLDTGTYEVFSKSRQTTSWHGTETMEYMVRFARGNNSNIGFHDIPVSTATGDEVQTLSELGTPLSDGCIRQDVVDARALWKFAPVGTTVVVVRT